MHFGTFGASFWPLGDHVGEPWVHRDTKGDTLGSMLGFSWIVDRFLDPLGSRF